jgi:hypothetical protein
MKAILLLIVCLTVPQQAFPQQRVELQFGARGGLPFELMFESNIQGVFSTQISQAYDRPPYSVGPEFTALFKDRLGLEVDALYAPVQGRSGGSTVAFSTTSTTHGWSWVFPIIADYHFRKPGTHFYLGGGTVAGETTGGTTQIRTTDNATGVTTIQTQNFHASPSQLPAVLVNGGLEWRTARFTIRPELRYTRWSLVSQNTIAARHPNQFEYLIGFSFREYKH